MLGFNEWRELTEASFKDSRDSWIGKNLVKTLGGDPDERIDIDKLLTNGNELKSTEELYSAIEKAIKMARDEGVRKSTMERNLLNLRKIKDNQYQLQYYATNLINAALEEEEKQKREKNRDPYERKMRKPVRKSFGKPVEIED